MTATTTIAPAIEQTDDLDTPITEHDCAMDELECERYEDGIDLDSRYL